MRLRALGCAVVLAAAGAAGPAAAQGKKANPPTGEVTLVCEASYQPARTTWTRTVRIGYDKTRVRSVLVDGVPVYTFSVRDTVILTAVDNERIQIDTAAQTWTSDFRGQATGEGRCERQ
ncbi:MAG: hypothetical protein KXJ61_13225 [Hydrogenophaga sp.]|jgi:hypothetical protein|uniref:hypothetical protein n=1 Tax=Hydrogenophaga sp. TaxID=1904254 RepID=UPI001D9A1397|nr:hypothetical protein [Hydrogenophaga sp.]MBW0171175.1 hypothetical protein [Hydrogenophaga sp.]MBW0184608.1 hypothetical protein [Hydrogenophaga sp.]